MKKQYPCIEIDLKKITHNTKEILALCSRRDIKVVGVTKVFCAMKPIVEAMVAGGMEMLGDSRIDNLKRLKGISCRKMLLRIPMKSQAAEVVKYCDISLNSELETIKSLSLSARRLNKTHHIILMIDMGDLREGILEQSITETVKEITMIPNIKLCGIGTNLTCYGGVIPDENNLGRLVKLKSNILKDFGIDLDIVSGGNSSSLYAVLEETIPEGINQLRIGEAIVLGKETAFGKQIPNCFSDAFTLRGEIVEIKEKPSVPIGHIGRDAFGQLPSFEDRGILKRAIIALGRQDIIPEGLEAADKSAVVLGASSDHLILDITKCSKAYKIGETIDFFLDYGCLLRAMTSPYVKKYYKK